jgi:hypothetical protein
MKVTSPQAKVVKAVALAETICKYFEDEIGGIYSDGAWYDTISSAYRYIEGTLTKDDFLEHLSFVMGYDEERWNAMMKKYVDQLAFMKNQLGVEGLA